MKPLLLLKLSLFLFSLSGFSQSYLYVKHDADGNNDGSSWVNAYTLIQPALVAAGSGTEIWVAAGTYYPTNEVGGSGNSYKTFQLKNNVELLGGFEGTEDPASFDIIDRDFDVNETILSGDLGAEHVFHVFRHVDLALNSTAVLDGFTIMGGEATGTSLDILGGGMLNSGASVGNGSSPSIKNCIFKSNSASEGGAIYNSRYCSPVINQTTFFENQALSKGGAVYNIRNTASFSNCIFQSNRAFGNLADDGGGALYIKTSTSSEGSVIINCQFLTNIADTAGSNTYGGGAIYASLDPGQIEISDSRFIGNEGGYGGAIYCKSGSDTNRDTSSVKISRSTFEENLAKYGGAIFSDKHHSILTSCIIRGNEALEQSGGFYSRYASSKLINSLITGNKSGKHGGGIYFNAETPEIINTSISGNYSGERGGGISIIGGTNLSIFNSIVWGNSSPEGNEFWVCSTCTLSITYSLYDNLSNDVFITNGGIVNTSNVLTINPVFLNPTEPTSANTPNILGNYFICGCTSPCIDAGDNSYLPIDLSTDLRGSNRTQDGNTDGTPVVDLGAYEYDPTGCNALAPFYGDGSAGNPYQISMLQHLYWISVDQSRWGFHYIQTADIGAGITLNWFSGQGWTPIGNNITKFSGSYDGKGHSISNLFINRPNSVEQGLFGKLGGTSLQSAVLKNITLINVDITGNREIGSLAGLTDQYNTITNCHSSGVVKGNRNTGGLVGWARRTDFWYCSSKANITAIGATPPLYHGGLLGHMNSSGNINQSFAEGNVSGRSRVGGLVGALGWSSQINNSYARGNVAADVSNPMMGGLVGEVWNGGIRYSYSTGTVNMTGITSDYGGLVGSKTSDNNYFDTENFYDEETSGLTTSSMGTGMITTAMKDQISYTSPNANWDFTTIWIIHPDINDAYPHLQWQQSNWTGLTNTHWYTATNWENELIPSSLSNVLLSSGKPNYPSIAPFTGVRVNNLILNSGASLVLESDNTGTGSLIINGTLTNNGSIYSQHCFPQADQTWHMLSSPISGSISTNGFNPGTNDDFYAWDEPTPGTWVNYKVNTGDLTFPTVNGGDNFVPGKGYLVAYTGIDPVKTFNANLNTGIITIPLKNSGGTKDWTYNSGWNLIGNPYSSGIDWYVADRTQFQDNFAYAYNPNKGGGAGYETIDGSEQGAFLKPHQGFFVLAKADANNQNFSFTPSMQRHESLFFKNEASQGIVIRISINENKYDETIVRIHHDSQLERDRRDAIKMYSFDPDIPQIYTLSNDQASLAINTIPEIDSETTIPIGVKIPELNQYTISLEQVDFRTSTEDIYLIDHEGKQVHNLSKADYLFTSIQGNHTARLTLHFGTEGLPEPEGQSENIVIWNQNELISISGAENYSFVELYDLHGRRLSRATINKQNLVHIHAPIQKGIYVVRLINQTKRYSKKVAIF